MSTATQTSPDLTLEPRSDRAFFVFNAVASIGAVSLLAYLLLIRRGGDGGWDLRFMPAVNAALNATCATFLVAGIVAIKTGRRRLHKFMMVGAVVASALFLVGYLAYHAAHGDTKYAGEGILRTVYLVMLASHVLLSIAVVPLVFTTVYYAARQVHARHKRVAKWTYPLWLYVSVTGVLIFFMLRGAAPAVG